MPGSRPVAVVADGHGTEPVVPIERDDLLPRHDLGIRGGEQTIEEARRRQRNGPMNYPK